MVTVNRANEDRGHYFFSASSMRFLHSRVLPGVIGGRYFITSERREFNLDCPRRFTIRIAHPDGSIDTASRFQAYATAGAARRAALRLP